MTKYMPLPRTMDAGLLVHCLDQMEPAEQQLVRNAAQAIADSLPDNVKAGPVIGLEIVAALGRLLCRCDEQELTASHHS
jgi:hypothetical protein